MMHHFSLIINYVKFSDNSSLGIIFFMLKLLFVVCQIVIFEFFGGDENKKLHIILSK